MATSRYESYVVRKPAIVGPGYADVVPEEDKIPSKSAVDTGPRVIFSPTLVPDGNSIVEYGIISGDLAVGTGEDFPPHKHDYEEIFLFLGQNTQDTSDLGAEVEFWLGEGEELDKVVIDTSSSVYIPPGLAHFPMIWRNVTRPVTLVVIMPVCGDRVLQIVPVEGRMSGR